MPPPELASWQLAVLDAVARLPLAKELRFGGGSALAAVYLHHRRSEDLDFFAMREVDLAELRPLTRALVGAGMEVDVRVLGVRTALLLRRGDAEIGRVDVAYYPYEPIARAVPWRGLAVVARAVISDRKLLKTLGYLESQSGEVTEDPEAVDTEEDGTDVPPASPTNGSPGVPAPLLPGT